MSEKPLIFEHRSAAYGVVCEQRSTENQWFLAIIVEFSTAPNEIYPNIPEDTYE